jgi:hypothetical protein
MDGFLEEHFGGELQRFILPIGQLRELQAKCDAGPATILTRLLAKQAALAAMPEPKTPKDAGILQMLSLLGGDWRVDDIRETVRLGLIGGGKTPSEAFILVSRYVDARPPMENLSLAAEILMVSLLGPEDDQVGKRVAEKDQTEATGGDASPSPDTTAGELS